jgi:hypothetical protein
LEEPVAETKKLTDFLAGICDWELEIAMMSRSVVSEICQDYCVEHKDQQDKGGLGHLRRDCQS